MAKNFYLTTTLPYVNASPHIGFALEIIEADVIARYQRLLGNNVFFNTGTDEHGQKIFQKAQEQNIAPQAYCDQYSQIFSALKPLLNLTFDNFICTTNPKHVAAAQEFWQRSLANGDIYKATYKIKYCVGCELEKTESDLENGHCPLHPDTQLEIREEENYFFRFSKYQQPLLEFYQQNPEFVLPSGKMKEIVSFVEQGLNDFSISRVKNKMPWGVAVPNDPDHVMYVWFDALINYISALGWPDNLELFNQYWPGIQLAGKDNLRQQAAMWQAMLMSAQLPNSKKILINGFISVAGKKMSKSLGNVISPKQMVEKYQADATRFLLISLGTFGGDIDVSWEKFDEKFDAQLANGLGNLCSRVAKMSSTVSLEINQKNLEFDEQFIALMNSYQLSAALEWIQEKIKQADLYLSQTKPWELVDQEKVLILQTVVHQIQIIAYHLQPFMPQTAQLIAHQFEGKIQAIAPLFPRIS